MGWSLCGTNRHGQETGYGVRATCDEPGCDEQIDRGLGYLCGDNYEIGDLHDHDNTCAKYYCGKHLIYVKVPGADRYVQVCSRCAAEIEKREGNDGSVSESDEEDPGNRREAT